MKPNFYLASLALSFAAVFAVGSQYTVNALHGDGHDFCYTEDSLLGQDAGPTHCFLSKRACEKDRSDEKSILLSISEIGINSSNELY